MLDSELWLALYLLALYLASTLSNAALARACEALMVPSAIGVATSDARHSSGRSLQSSTDLLACMHDMAAWASSGARISVRAMACP